MAEGKEFTTVAANSADLVGYRTSKSKYDPLIEDALKLKKGEAIEVRGENEEFLDQGGVMRVYNSLKHLKSSKEARGQVIPVKIRRKDGRVYLEKE